MYADNQSNPILNLQITDHESFSNWASTPRKLL